MSKRRIIISNHARKRLHERVVDPYNDSYRRMVSYAWNKGKTPESIRKKNPAAAKLVLSRTYAGGSKVLKIYGNYVFLFSCKRSGERILVTVMSIEEMIKKQREEQYKILEIIKLDWGISMVIYRNLITEINSIRLVQGAVTEDDDLMDKSKDLFFRKKDLNYDESRDCVTVTFDLDEDTDQALQAFCDKHMVSQHALWVGVSKFLCDPDNIECIAVAMKDLAEKGNQKSVD